MGKPSVILIWTFVIVCASYDSWFAWNHQKELQAWELNPFVCWAAQAFGLATVIAFKASGIIFAAWLAAYCYKRHYGLSQSLTAVAGVAYLLVGALYCADYIPPLGAGGQQVETRLLFSMAQTRALR
jgi:hypothetical protein